MAAVAELVSSQPPGQSIVRISHLIDRGSRYEHSNIGSVLKRRIRSLGGPIRAHFCDNLYGHGGAISRTTRRSPLPKTEVYNRSRPWYDFIHRDVTNNVTVFIILL
jgi:hypothetical protein